MTREQMINKLVADDVDTVQQWAIQGCYEDLWNWVRDVVNYDALKDEDILQQYDARFDYMQLDDGDIELMENAKQGDFEKYFSKSFSFSCFCIIFVL